MKDMAKVVKAYYEGKVQVVDVDEVPDVDEVKFEEIEELASVLSSNVIVRYFYIPALNIICRYADF